MKLEGELNFFHSKIGREPETQSFEFNDNDQDSAGCKLQNQKLKGYENKDLNKNENMGSARRIATPELGFYDSIIDLNNDCKALAIDLVEPVSHSSENIESFMKFPNDKEMVKKSPTSQISNPPKYRNPFEDSVDDYMDKTVTEFKPELVLFQKESNYNVVKDICVDEGVLTKPKVMFGNSVDEKSYNFFASKSFENNEKQKDHNGINVQDLPATGDSYQVSANHDQLKDLMHSDAVAENLIGGNVNKEMALPKDKVFWGMQDSVVSDDKDKEVSAEPELHSQSEGSKNKVEEAVLGNPASPSDVSNNDGMFLESGRFTSQFDLSASAECGKQQCHQVGHCKCNETQQTSLPVEWQSDDQTVTCQIRRSLGESSFSAVGPVSSHISYSGSVPYSGSISLRSDSSTTSTRSFAFPVLQSEWNSSPVRMAKADRSNYRKHRGWRRGLCCRF